MWSTRARLACMAWSAFLRGQNNVLPCDLEEGCEDGQSRRTNLVPVSAALLVIVELLNHFFGDRSLQYRRGEHGRGCCGPVVAQLVEEAFQMLHRDNARLDDERVGAGDSVALENLLPCLYLLLKCTHE